MMLNELNTVASAALPIRELADHLRMGSGFSDDIRQDGLLESYLRASISAVESKTGCVLLEKEYSWSLTRWQKKDRQILPLRPVQEIQSLTMIAGTGSETQLAVETVILVQDDLSPAIEPVGNCLPAISGSGQIEIGFKVGFGPAWADVPANLGHATLILAAHFYENRSAPAGSSDGLPKTVASLLQPFMKIRIGRGV